MPEIPPGDRLDGRPFHGDPGMCQGRTVGFAYVQRGFREAVLADALGGVGRTKRAHDGDLVGV